ncbi:hypothetical protein D4R71_07050 [bacterium]|nr:MAG: hypothetical protein D4R71_07050 [bacterium]
MEDKEINLVDYWNIIWKKRKFIVITVIVVTILSAGISMILPKWYKATAVILPPVNEEGQFGGLGANLSAFGLGGMLGGGESQMRLLAILKSRALLKSISEKFDYQERYKIDNWESTIKMVREHIMINVGDEEQIEVSVLDKNQGIVADISNYAVKCLDSLNIALTTSKAKSSREFIENRMEIVRDSLNNLENNISQFMEKKGIISITDQMKAGVEKAADMKALIMSKEVELEVKKRVLTPNCPEVIALERELKILHNKFDEFYSDKSSDKLFLNFESIPDMQKEYLQLKRKAEYYAKLLEYLGPQYEQAKIEEVKDVPTVQVLDRAVRPEKRAKPNRKMIVILSFLISLLIFIFIAFLVEKIHKIIRL